MDNLNSWKVFEATGKIEDYLKYADERRINKARESFIARIKDTEGIWKNNSFRPWRKKT